MGARNAVSALPVVPLDKMDPKVAAILGQRIDAVRRQPKSAEAWGWLGALLRAYDFRPEACECLAQAGRLDPGNPRWPYHHALALMIATPNQAIPLFRKSVQICGNTPEGPRFRLARLLAEQGRWDEARQEYEPLLAAHPEFAPARLLAARAAQAKGDTARGVELAQSCVQDPRTARSAWVLLAALHRQKGDMAAAGQAVQRSAAMPPDEGFGDPFESEVTLLRGDSRVLGEQAHPLLAAGRLDEAAALIERMRSEHAEDPETWLLAGRLCLLRKDLAGAEQALRKHIGMSPRSVQGLFQLGLVLLARERFDEAASTFEKTTDLKKDFGPAWYNRGLALGRAKRVREAAAAFQESLRHNPERLDTYLFLAELKFHLGEREAALALLAQAQTIDPSSPRLRALLDRSGGK
jgi:tetratricopeptide (TPR) repeat protein